MKSSSFHISGEDTVYTVQDRFSQLFPLLTINFYSQESPSVHSCVMFSPDCRICDLNPQLRDGIIQITQGMMPDEMENVIHSNFGLHAEITEKKREYRLLTSHISKWLFNEKYPGLKFLYEDRSPAYFQNIPFGC